MRLTIDELKTLPEYLTLCEAHKTFVKHLLANNYDAVEAAHLTYPDHSNPTILSAGLMQHWKVARVLDRHFGRPLIDRVLADLHTVIRQCQRRKGKMTPETARALTVGINFYERMTGQPLSVDGESPKAQEQKS